MHAFHVRTQDEVRRGIVGGPFHIVAELPEILQKERIPKMKNVHTNTGLPCRFHSIHRCIGLIT